MKLTRNILFSVILVFGLASISLVVFNIQTFYLRAIFSFLFLITIPGLLIMLVLRIREIGFWEYLVYTVGLSISFLMFGGLAVNWILPFLKITDKPLALIPIASCFGITLFIFGIIAYVRNKDLSFKLTIPKLNATSKIFLITPVIFPVLSITGAITLNNGGSNYLTMIMLVGITVYVLMIVLFRNKLNENIYPWLILMLSVALILMGSLRGWYISHTDAAQEYALFKLTLSNNFWDYWIVKNSYNGMISVAILPTILIGFLKVNAFLISKLIFPIIYLFLPVSMYIILRKFFNSNISLFGVLFFIFQPAFTAWTLIPPRQEIAFFYFALMILIIFSNILTRNLKRILFILFGFSMVVSHYSTTYIAIFLFGLIYITYFLYRFLIIKKKSQHKPLSVNKNQHFFSIDLLLPLIVFIYVWYFLLTTTGQGLTSFGSKNIVNLNGILNEELYSSGNSPLEYLHVLGIGKSIEIDQNADLVKYNKEIVRKLQYSHSEKIKLANYPLVLKNTSQLPLKWSIFNYYFSKAEQMLILLGIMFIVIGLFIYGILNRKTSEFFLITGITFLFSLFILLLSPFTSTDYNQHRIYQQVLIILAVFPIYAFTKLFRSNKFLGYFTFSIILIFYFILFTHVQYYFTGGREVQLRFANIGKDYDLHYVTASEIFSANWLYENKKLNTPILADQYALYKLYQSDKFNFGSPIKMDVLPSSIDKEDYVYSSRSNTLRKITFKYYGRGLLIYNFPTDFLNRNKNLIYNNKESLIYK